MTKPERLVVRYGVGGLVTVGPVIIRRERLRRGEVLVTLVGEVRPWIR